MPRRALLASALALSALVGVGSGAAQTPAPAAAAPAPAKPVDAAERKAVLEELAAQLEANFVFPDIGQRYAAMLRAKLASGAYDQVSDPTEFAKAVTADIQAIYPDGHLKLVLARAPSGGPNGGPGGPRPTFGLEETRMIGDVAYLRYSGFPGDDEATARARKFLLDHAGDAKAVIIDSRGNHGGGLDEMDALLPLLYAETATLVRMDTRAASDRGNPLGDQGNLVRRPSPDTLVRRDHVITPDKTETRLQHVPVYYLVSHQTASAGEHLALAFKHTHRAVLIGETTRGAGHYGGTRKFGERFQAFIPIGRTYDPDTNWDWEGKGVAPDVAVDPAKALDEALARAKTAGAHPE
ncbi:MAG: S41 family peptidase [Proteobacteria bacterium]|nr:S41 family peptidase [Pseudomonadota bacterium]